MSLLTGLQVYYSLSDLTDASGGGLTLTNNNSATFGTGKVGNAVTVVASSSQYLSRADAAAFQMGTGDFTIACWIKSTDADDFKAAMVYGERGNAGYGFTWVSSTIRFFVGEDFPWDQATVDVGTNLASGGLWHLVVGVCDRTAQQIKVYWDGSSNVSSPVSCSIIGSVNNTAGIKIGAHKATAADFWDGSVDELGIWNRVLTTTEIDELWNGGAGLPFSSFAPTVTVNLTGVSASPAIGTGTVEIGSVVVEPPVEEFVPSRWFGLPEDEKVYLTGVAANPKVGDIRPVGKVTLPELDKMYQPFPRREQERPLTRLVPQKKAPEPPKPVAVVYMAGVHPVPRVGSVTTKAFYEDIDEELIGILELIV